MCCSGSVNIQPRVCMNSRHGCGGSYSHAARCGQTYIKPLFAAITPLSNRLRAKSRNKSKIRARVEYVFAVVKRRWGFTKVRYRGLARNACRAFTALALANIYLARHRLLAQECP